MTHLLITIKSVEEKISNYTRLLKEAALDRTDTGKLNFIRYSGKIAILQNILKEERSISLDEKNIEVKSKIFANDKMKEWVGSAYQDRLYLQEGYKQALKDLL